MSVPESFPTYPSDWLSSTHVSLMLPEQEGAYFRLICHAWADEHCSLPADDRSLATLSRLGSRWKRLKPAIMACFEQHPTLPGRLVNKRLSAIRRSQDESAIQREEAEAQRREAGRLAAAKRWQGNGSPMPDPLGDPCQTHGKPIGDPLANAPPGNGSAIAAAPVSPCQSHTDRIAAAPKVSGGEGGAILLESISSSPEESRKSKEDPELKKPRYARVRARDAAKETWLSVYAETWTAHTGGVFPFGEAARVLKQLHEMHGTELVARHLGNYLREYSGTDARFLSLSRFAQTFGQWNGQLGHSRATTAAEKTMENVRRFLAQPLQDETETEEFHDAE